MKCVILLFSLVCLAASATPDIAFVEEAGKRVGYKVAGGGADFLFLPLFLVRVLRAF